MFCWWYEQGPFSSFFSPSPCVVWCGSDIYLPFYVTRRSIVSGGRLWFAIYCKQHICLFVTFSHFLICSLWCLWVCVCAYVRALLSILHVCLCRFDSNRIQFNVWQIRWKTLTAHNFFFSALRVFFRLVLLLCTKTRDCLFDSVFGWSLIVESFCFALLFCHSIPNLLRCFEGLWESESDF